MADWIREGSPEHYTRTAKEYADDAAASATSAREASASAVDASDKAAKSLAESEEVLEVVKSYASSADYAAVWAAESAEDASQNAEAAYYFAEMASEEAFNISEATDRIDMLEEYALDVDAELLSEGGRSVISALGFPSVEFEDMADVAADAAFTAPANGYFVCTRVADEPGQTLELVDETSLLRSFASACEADTELSVWLPAMNGDEVTLGGTASGEISVLGFAYAEGEV